MRKYWYITAIFFIYLIALSWRTVGCVSLSGPLKKGGYEIARSAIEWWNSSEHNGGAGRTPLDHVDFSAMQLNPELFRQHETDSSTLSYWRSSKNRLFSTYSPHHGFYDVEVVPPNHIILSGSRGSLKYGGAFVQFKTKINLSRSFDNVNIRTRHKWLFGN